MQHHQHQRQQHQTPQALAQRVMLSSTETVRSIRETLSDAVGRESSLGSSLARRASLAKISTRRPIRSKAIMHMMTDAGLKIRTIRALLQGQVTTLVMREDLLPAILQQMLAATMQQKEQAAQAPQILQQRVVSHGNVNPLRLMVSHGNVNPQSGDNGPKPAVVPADYQIGPGSIFRSVCVTFDPMSLGSCRRSSDFFTSVGGTQARPRCVPSYKQLDSTKRALR
jgi:hypothetical protein